MPDGVRAVGPCRVDLAGGTLDIWPLGLLHPGAMTVNVAVGVWVTVELRPRRQGYRVIQGGEVVEAIGVEELASHEETALVGVVLQALGMPPVDVTIESRSPRGGGLGASSTLAICLIVAGETLLESDPRSSAQRSALARDLEARLMALPTGRQDHFPSLVGGLLAIEHRPGGEVVRRLESNLESLSESLMVFYTGQSHFSAGNNWRIVRRRLEGEADTVARFEGLCQVAQSLAEALENDDLPSVGRLMSDEWSLRRGLAEGVSTATIENLLDLAGQEGAWGGKACGAGGGGCIAVLAPPASRDAVASRLKDAGARYLSAPVVVDPVRVDRIG